MSKEPLTPKDLDLRDFPWMPLDVGSLRDSNMAILASGDAFRAAVLLWCASWHQVPAASLPNEDRLLANLAGYGRDLDGWAAVRDEALCSFIECSDGRLYHPVVAAKAIEAGEHRKKQRKRTEAATLARRGVKRDDGLNDHRNDRRNDDCSDRPNDHRNDLQQKGPDQTTPDRIALSRSIKGDRPEPARSAGDALQALAVRGEPSHFDYFWQTYPRRDGANPRKPAEAKFAALVKSGVDPEKMISEVKKLAQMETTRGNIGTRFIPQAITWLNQQRWADHAAIAFLAEQASVELHIEKAVQMFAKMGFWSKHAGPEPGQSGCKASPELLAKYGIRADGRKLQTMT